MPEGSERGLRLVPDAACRAFARGDDREALSVLRRARDTWPPSSAQWAFLERLVGLVLIHTLREVEGTFALERADELLEERGWPLPDLDLLQDTDS
ncbi:hypothetical protein [Deinococcus peraridilitoris]|uniref:hypothetical protein n=1 Tax=Deinococcus peraridilitoris TaxID=432329 RepID=UPI00059E178C|nr:hypothetical protein [Deinococcus peraridilitoris]